MSWGTNVLVGQSGGPTAVINSSLAGVYEAAKALGAAHVYGMESVSYTHLTLPTSDLV